MELARNLKVESVIRLKPTEDYRLAPEATITQAIFLMREKKIGCVLICRDDHLLGLFTERDLIRRVLARRLPLIPHPTSDDSKPRGCLAQRLHQFRNS